MNRTVRALAIAALCIAVPSLHAQEVTGNPVIVTATRTAQTADETLAAVSVITREDIERLQARSLDDLLRGEPGISVSNSGGPGKATSIFVRGTEADHVLVLIDGIKVGSPTLGTTSFENIPVEQIERIEIVRGPRSSLYGSEAIGGVIQIFTRRGGGPLAPTFSVGGGSHGTSNGAVGVSGGGDQLRMNAFVSGLGTQGFNACRGVANVAGCFTDEPDKDGFHEASGSLRAGYRFSDSSDIDLHWLRMQGHMNFDGSTVNRSDFVQEVYGAQYRFAPTKTWRATFIAGHNRDDTDNSHDGAFFSRFNTDRDVLSLQNDFALGSAQLVSVGADYQNEQVQSTVAFPVTSRDNTGVFALHQATFGKHNTELSLRQDHNEQFGTRNTGAAAWGYHIAPDVRVRASYGTAFKAPTFNELFFPFFGNPDLKPEQSRSAELGVNGTAAAYRWSVTAFQTDVDQLIGFDANFAPVNIDKARIRGLENTLATRFVNWDLSGSLTLLDPRNRSEGANDGKILPRRARESFRLEATHVYGAYRYGPLLRAEGARFDDQANTQRLGGYGTVDLVGEYAFAKGWLAQARVANLFDKTYETAQFFNQPGREFFITVRYQP